MLINSITLKSAEEAVAILKRRAPSRFIEKVVVNKKVSKELLKLPTKNTTPLYGVPVFIKKYIKRVRVCYKSE